MTLSPKFPIIAVLGASGLIGEALCRRLTDQGHAVVPVARTFTPAQAAAFGKRAVRFPVVASEAAALEAMLLATGAEVVVNCIGVLQDTAQASSDDVHRKFAERLLQAMKRDDGPSSLLVHLSIPGEASGDGTVFSRTKRAAEAAIRGAGVPHAILRPAFVVTGAAYGGSALMRALAMMPIGLPRALADGPFAVTDLDDIARSVDHLATRWCEGERHFAETWDVMESQRSTVGEVLEALASHLGGPKRRFVPPAWLLDLGCRAGDGVARLGWRPAIRSTALAEMRRGVVGDPSGWSAATGIVPLTGREIIGRLPSSVQERWFARLYLLKALTIVVLSLFWIVSGLIALTVAFDAATKILLDHGFAPALAKTVTVASSFVDIAVGLSIAWRSTSKTGLLAGIAVSLFYMASAAVITPDMWLDPLGALVKTGPAIVLMLVALAVLDDR